MKDNALFWTKLGLRGALGAGRPRRGANTVAYKPVTKTPKSRKRRAANKRARVARRANRK